MKHFTLICLLILTFIVPNTSFAALADNLSGMILLQIEENGEAWYIYPGDKQRYYLGRPADAFEIMRELGLGIKHETLTQYLNSNFPSSLSGKILLDVEQNGEAYYIYPKDLKGYYLGRPHDAFAIMREKGLGITNADLLTITVAKANMPSEQFIECLETKKYDSVVQANIDYGYALGVVGTPTTFIEGVEISGYQSYPFFELVLDELLIDDPTAVYEIEVFMDYECPFCYRFDGVIDLIYLNYYDNVDIHFYHFPLDFNSNARTAANAAECANEQNKFWEMHEKLFDLANNNALNIDNIKEAAATLNL